MTVTLDAVEGDPRQIIADLERRLSESTAERDEALQKSRNDRFRLGFRMPAWREHSTR